MNRQIMRLRTVFYLIAFLATIVGCGHESGSRLPDGQALDRLLNEISVPKYFESLHEQCMQRMRDNAIAPSENDITDDQNCRDQAFAGAFETEAEVIRGKLQSFYVDEVGSRLRDDPRWLLIDVDLERCIKEGLTDPSNEPGRNERECLAGERVGERRAELRALYEPGFLERHEGLVRHLVKLKAEDAPASQR